MLMTDNGSYIIKKCHLNRTSYQEQHMIPHYQYQHSTVCVVVASFIHQKGSIRQYERFVVVLLCIRLILGGEQQTFGENVRGGQHILSRNGGH